MFLGFRVSLALLLTATFVLNRDFGDLYVVPIQKQEEPVSAALPGTENESGSCAGPNGAPICAFWPERSPSSINISGWIRYVSPPFLYVTSQEHGAYDTEAGVSHSNPNGALLFCTIPHMLPWFYVRLPSILVRRLEAKRYE